MTTRIFSYIALCICYILWIYFLTGCLSLPHAFSPSHSPVSFFQKLVSPAPVPSPKSNANPITTSQPKPAMNAIIQSASVPEIIYDKIYLIYIGAFICFLCCALAIWGQHFLAAIKFGFAGIGGILLAHFVSFILGSFVMACLFSFGFG